MCDCKYGVPAMLQASIAALGHHPPLVLKDGIWHMTGKQDTAVSNGDSDHVGRIIAARIKQAQVCEHGRKHKLPIWC